MGCAVGPQRLLLLLCEDRSFPLEEIDQAAVFNAHHPFEDLAATQSAGAVHVEFHACRRHRRVIDIAVTQFGREPS